MRRLFPALLLCAAVAACASPAAAAVSSSEQRALAAVRAGAPAAESLLVRLVNQNSGTLHPEGVRAVGAMLLPRFEALGFKARWVDGAAWGRAGHLLAERVGRRASLRVLLVGHLDTVFEPDSPFQRFERLDDSTARGPGIADMKGGDMVMLLALEGLRASGDLERLDVRVVLTGDEERMGSPRSLARADLLDAAQGRDVAIDFENGSGRTGEAIVARRSASGWVLRVSGTPAHSSQIFRPAVGAGAVYEAARILECFRDSLAGEPHLTFNAGLVVGGTHAAFTGGGRGEASGKTNVVPESVLVAGDLRALTPEQVERTQATMARIAARHLPHTGAVIEFDEGYPPLAPAAGHDAILAVYDRVSRDLGDGPVTATNADDAGASDIAWAGGIVPMVLDGVGLSGSGGHTVNETGDLRALPRNAGRVAILLARLARTPR
jgi:glutamate carboxypeptidase